VKPLLVEGEVPVTQVLLRCRRLVERDEEQIELLAVCEFDPSVIVAKVPFPGTMIEGCAQLDAEIPCVQRNLDSIKLAQTSSVPRRNHRAAAREVGQAEKSNRSMRVTSL